jgi:hypothetical protein
MILLIAFLAQQSATIEITVDAGARDRRDCVVAVPVTIPAPSAGAATAILEDGSGKTLNGQIASGRELRFVLPELKAGQSASYKVTFIREPSKLDETFVWKDTEGDYAEASIGKRPVLRYMYKALDESSKDARTETYKVFHHLYDPKGETFVTKGAGSQFTHHRGIFYGFNKVTYGDNKNCDVWHCTNDAFQSHEKFMLTEAGPVYARHRLAVAWHGVKKEVFASEERDLTVYALPAARSSNSSPSSRR